MAKILFLAHRIPYPPNKGDKIRSWHMLKYLADRHEVHLGAFVDDADDWQHAEHLQRVCAEVKLVGLNPRTAKVASLVSLVRGEPLSLGYYRSGVMQRWVTAKLAEGFDSVLLFSSPMAQFVLGRVTPGTRVVMDFVDIDSDKWAQYARHHSGPMGWIYAREARTLASFERKVANAVDRSVFVSAAEAEMFKGMAPEQAASICAVNNGVDHQHFSPDRSYANPFNGAPTLVLTGAMDYWANAEAAEWFARSVLPLIQAARPDVRFYIVGGKPTPAVQALGNLSGVTVTGRVEDVRPYIAHADVVVAPLRVARGVQNKVLEGMAMARPVVATPQAAEGIDCLPGRELWVADGEAGFAEACMDALISPERNAIMTRARARILKSYDWDAALATLNELLAVPGGGDVAAHRPALVS